MNENKKWYLAMGSFFILQIICTILMPVFVIYMGLLAIFPIAGMQGLAWGIVILEGIRADKEENGNNNNK